MKYDIIVPTYNLSDKTIRCFGRIDLYTKNYRLIWIDNGSDANEYSKVADFLKSNKIKVLPISVKENLGFVKAVNIGFGFATAPWKVLLNNDVYVTDGWLDRMVECADKNNYDIVGPMTSPNAGQHQSVTHLSKTIRSNIPDWTGYNTDQYAKLVAEKMKGDHAKISGGMVAFFCTAIRSTVIARLGYLSEEYGIGLGDDDGYSYDNKTQIVTNSGIKYLKDVTLNDQILTLRSDNVMEYHKPIKIFRHFENELYNFTSRRLDIMCSKKQYLYIGYKNGNGKITKPLEFIRADMLQNTLPDGESKYFVKKNGGVWYGNDFDTININGWEFNTELFVKLCAWYLSEGSCGSQNNYNYQISIAQSKKNESYKLEIYNIIRSIGCNPYIYEHCVKFTNKLLCLYFKQFGISVQKHIPQCIKDLSPKYLEIFLDTYIKGDGTFKKHGAFEMSTVSKKMRDDLIELLLKTKNTFNVYTRDIYKRYWSSGIVSNCKKCYIINVTRDFKERTTINKANIIEYNDYTYDVEVPNHVMYVIRNGKGCWSGNCSRARRNGFRIGIDLSTYVEHEHRSTFKSMFTPKEIGELQGIALKTFRERQQNLK